MEKNETAKSSRFLTWIENSCNKLPPPALIFMFLFLITAVLSFILSMLNVSLYNPATEQDIVAYNFFSVDGLYWFLSHMLTNFTSFPPLGLVLVMTVAVGLCEESGLIEIILKEKLNHVLPQLLPYVVAFIGILGNIASDTACILVPPIAGLVYLATGKHPIVGMICGYAAVMAGFSANIMVAGTDGLLQVITQNTVNDFLGPGKINIDITCNWFFMMASTFLCTLVIGFMCNHFVEKRFGSYVPVEGLKINKNEGATPEQKKALRFAGIALLIYVAIVVAATIWGPLGIVVGFEGDGRRSFVGSYMIKYLVPILVFFFSIPGIVYGTMTGAFKGLEGVYNAMVKIMSRLGGYLVFCFFCSQFQALFSWTNIDKILAISGANFLNATGFTGYGLIIAFILVCGFINFFIQSASAKWAIFAPVFIPMMIMAGNYHPAMTQLFFRLGDSPTNGFSPFSPYIWVTLKTAQDTYDPKLKMGTLVSNLLPVCLVLLVIWIIFLIIWMMLGIPVGPGVEIYLS